MSRNPTDTPPVFHTTNTHFVVLDTDDTANPDTTVIVVKAQRIWTGLHGRAVVQPPAETTWELTPVFWSKQQEEEWAMHTTTVGGRLLVKGEDKARDTANELAVTVHDMNVEAAQVKLKHAHIANDLATKGSTDG